MHKKIIWIYISGVWGTSDVPSDYMDSGLKVYKNIYTLHLGLSRCNQYNISARLLTYADK